MNCPISKIEGYLSFTISLELVEIKRRLNKKSLVVFRDASGSLIEMSVGDNLHLMLPVNAVPDTGAEQKLRKIKEAAKEICSE